MICHLWQLKVQAVPKVSPESFEIKCKVQLCFELKNLLIASDVYTKPCVTPFFLPKKSISVGTISVNFDLVGNSLHISGSVYPICEASVACQNCGRSNDCVFQFSAIMTLPASRLVPNTFRVSCL